MSITRQEAEERIERVLEAAGITADIWVCGGEVDISIEFPDGSTFSGGCILDIVCDGLSHQRG